ncbi:MAG: hypothetical protein M1814_002170 [Vezdaea aestivalis]|nr:MAG: hypothetical protein M1814_002170 [Vezdaea aestivalis]
MAELKNARLDATADIITTICKLFEGGMFVDLLSEDDLDDASRHDLALRRMFCDFLAASLLTGLARAEDHRETQLQHYLTCRTHIDSFRSRLETQLIRLEPDGAPYTDSRHKFAILLAYDFEATARLKKWDDWKSIIDECALANDIRLFSTIADIVLSTDAQSESIQSPLSPNPLFPSISNLHSNIPSPLQRRSKPSGT